MQIELANSNGYQTEIPQRLFIKKQPESIFTKTQGGGGGLMHLKNVSTIAEVSCCFCRPMANLLP